MTRAIVVSSLRAADGAPARPCAGPVAREATTAAAAKGRRALVLDSDAVCAEVAALLPRLTAGEAPRGRRLTAARPPHDRAPGRTLRALPPIAAGRHDSRPA